MWRYRKNWSRNSLQKENLEITVNHSTYLYFFTNTIPMTHTATTSTTDTDTRQTIQRTINDKIHPNLYNSSE